ncbi:MAG: hypothetical protein KY391_06755 [Actinobacteria bacterium]|nr:hypothetical protein [Actinomycetota bacterium]
MRIFIDPDELNRFAGFAAAAADDHSDRAARLRSMELPPMPDEVRAAVGDALARVVADLEDLAGSLYGEGLMLRSRAAAVDPVLSSYLMRGLSSLPA